MLSLYYKEGNLLCQLKKESFNNNDESKRGCPRKPDSPNEKRLILLFHNSRYPGFPPAVGHIGFFHRSFSSHSSRWVDTYDGRVRQTGETGVGHAAQVFDARRQT